MTLICVIQREGGRHSQIPAVNCAYFRALWDEGVYYKEFFVCFYLRETKEYNNTPKF